MADFGIIGLGMQAPYLVDTLARDLRERTGKVAEKVAEGSAPAAVKQVVARFAAAVERQTDAWIAEAEANMPRY